ncbi:MAG: hypothetical protein ACK5LX_09285, partial [Oscillospiraceae bacterium]
NSDPNGNGQADEIPLSGGSSVLQQRMNDIYMTLSWFGKPVEAKRAENLPALLGSTADGQVYYGPLTDEWKDMVSWWARAWADGLIDPAFFEQTDAAVKAKGQAEGDQTIGMFQSPGAFLVVPSEQNEDYIVVPPVTNKEGQTPQWIQYSGLTRGALAVTNKCEYPEVVLRMADWVYEWQEYDGAIYNMRGEPGVDFFYVDENGEQTEQAAIDRKFLVLEYEGFESFEVKRAKTLTPNSGSATPGIGGGTMPQVIFPLNDWINLQVEEQLQPHLVLAFPDVYVAADKVDRAASLKADLNNVVSMWTAQIITGEKSVENDYDEFIEQLKNIGAEEYQQIYQEAYDSWS